MSDNITMFLSGIGFAGIGIVLSVYNFIKQQKPRRIGKAQLFSTFFIFLGIDFALLTLIEDLNMMIPLFLITFGIPLLAIGTFNLILAHRCTQQITAKCVFFSTYGRGEKAPVFEYTYEGEYYKASAQQSFSTNMFVMNKSYRIYIDPNRPQYNIVFPKSMKDNKTTVAAGAIMIVLGIVLFFVFKYNLLELIQANF